MGLGRKMCTWRKRKSANIFVNISYVNGKIAGFLLLPPSEGLDPRTAIEGSFSVWGGLGKPDRGLGRGKTFFPDSGSDRESDETFQISRNLGLEHVEFFCLLYSQPCPESTFLSSKLQNFLIFSFIGGHFRFSKSSSECRFQIRILIRLYCPDWLRIYIMEKSASSWPGTLIKKEKKILRKCTVPLISLCSTCQREKV